MKGLFSQPSPDFPTNEEETASSRISSLPAEGLSRSFGTQMTGKSARPTDERNGVSDFRDRIGTSSLAPAQSVPTLAGRGPFLLFDVPLVSLIERRLLAELLTVFAIVLAVLTGLLLTVGSLKEAVPQGVSLSTLLRLMPYVVPEALRYSIPAALLFALHSVYGRMSADNELLALKSAGISPLRTVTPGLALALLLSLPTVWLTDLSVSWGHTGIQQLLLESVQEIVYTNLRVHHSYATPRLSLAVRGVEGRTLIQPTLQLLDSEGQGSTTVTAAEGELFTRRDVGRFGISFREGSLTTPGDLTINFPDTYEVAFSLRQASRNDLDEHFSLGEIFAEIARSEARIQQLEREQMASKVGWDKVAERPQAHPSVQTELDRERARLNQLRSRPHRRWAHGLSCLSFALFGIPWAVRSRNGDFFHSFFMSFLPVLLFYYPIEMLLASSPRLPPYTIWVADASLVLAGLFFVRRIWKH